MFKPTISRAFMVPAIVIMLVTGGAVGYVSFMNARNAVNEISHDLRHEISSRVADHLYHLLESQTYVLRETALTIASGDLDVTDVGLLERYLLRKAENYPNFSSIYFANLQGGIVVGGHDGKRKSFYTISTENLAAGTFNKFEVDSRGEKQKLLLSLPDFDARTRPWYEKAVAVEDVVFGDIYVLFTGQDMSLPPSRAVRDNAGTLLGVVGADVFLSQIGDFLQSMHDDKPGATFIMETSGLLVATSTGERPVVEDREHEGLRRLLATDSTHPRIVESAQAIRERFGSSFQVEHQEDLILDNGNGKSFVEVVPFRAAGLSWVIATVVPESAFLGAIKEGNRRTVQLILVSLFTMTVVMALLVRWVTAPLKQLTGMAQEVAEGDLDQTLDFGREDEIGTLARSFSEMTRKLKSSIAVRMEQLEETRKAEARFKNLFESSEVSIFVEDFSEIPRYLKEIRSQGIDDLQAYLDDNPDVVSELISKVEVVGVNAAALKLFEANREDQLIISIDRHFGEDAREVFVAGLTAIWNGERRFRSEANLRTLKGKDLTVILSYPIPALGEGTRDVPVSILDISDHRKTELRLRQAQRMEAVGQLAGGIAHEFNNLLQVIETNLSLVLESIGIDLAPGTLLKDARNAGRRGARLASHLLAYSRQKSLRPGKYQTNELVMGMTELIGRTLGEDVRIELDLADDAGEIFIDEHELTNALVTIALNARAAMPKGGVLSVRSQRSRFFGEAPLDDHDVLPTGDYVEISITDNGTGMTEHVRMHAFEPFFTTREVGEGSGLGLSMVFGFARQSGGTAVLESELGVGTTVRILLPVAAEEDAEIAEGEVRSHIGPLRIRVLQVEDDPDVRRSTAFLLESLECEVTAVESASLALEALKENENFDLLFSDVVLPDGKNGIELATEVKKLWPNLAVILVSGYPITALENMGLPDHGFHFLNKPFSGAMLSNLMDELFWK